MHTEHLQNVHPIRVLGGWLVSVAATSVVVFGFIVLNLMRGGTGDSAWAVLAVGIGFLVGGVFTGVRTLEAPILHGIALGLTSLVAWAILNLFAAAVLGVEEWSGLGTTAALVVLLVQIVAAVLGCWVGTGQARGQAEEEGPPSTDRIPE